LSKSSHLFQFRSHHQGDDEELYLNVGATLDGLRGELMVTDRRLVFIRNEWFGSTVHDIAVDDISHVEADTGVDTLTMEFDGQEFRLQSSDAHQTVHAALADLLGGREPTPPEHFDARESDDPYERPWYDSTGLVLVATVLAVPLGIIGWARRGGLAETGRSKFWHHGSALWLLSLAVYTAPVGIYGFIRRIRDEEYETSPFDHAGAVVATSISCLLVASYVSLPI
jgi:hypothetical protein